MNYKFAEGEVLLFDKPLNWTSFDVVNKIRYAIRKNINQKNIKVGHAGTLDPLATGLLILCTGKMTKNIDQIQAQTKEYVAELHLGAITPSYDLETIPQDFKDISHITNENIQDILPQFTGKIQQKPPIFSAIKIDGKRLYEHAHKGNYDAVEIPSREILIESIEILEINFPKIKINVVCSKGTYIRTLAHDIGQVLGVGAYLSALERTKIGNYDIKNAIQISDFVKELGI
jgi:tRNA pseudouridine55 synthase